MNNTTNLTAIVAIFIAATLVVGTFATTTKIAFAASNNSGNTVTIQKCKQAATQSGFDNTQNQECENLICTHPGNNATCIQEGAAVTTPTSTPPTPVNKTCEQCFTSLLTPQQITVVVSSEPSLADLCTSLEQGLISETALIRQLNVAGVSETIQAQLIQCLIDAGLPFEPLIV